MADRELIAAILTAGMLPTLEIPRSRVGGSPRPLVGGRAIERKWREARLYQTAPISTNMILAYIGQHVLGMPRSY